MLNSKQRAQLRARANGIDTIFQVGKGGITDALVKQTDDALTARELIKLRVLETAPEEVRTVANQLAMRTHADVVQVIGSRLVLYRANPDLKEPIRLCR